MVDQTSGGTAFTSIPVFNMQVPKQRPAALSFNFNFAGVDIHKIDLLEMKNQERFLSAQAIYYDNSYQDESVIFFCPQTGQTIGIDGRTQGYRNILVGDDMKFQFESEGTGIFNVQVINVPMYPDQWAATLTP